MKTKKNLQFTHNPNGFWVKTKELESAKDKAEAKEFYNGLITACVVFVVIFVAVSLLNWDNIITINP